MEVAQGVAPDVLITCLMMLSVAMRTFSSLFSNRCSKKVIT
jgi:hypothetical protein